MPVQVPVSVGELLDKLTILAIKLERIDDAAKRANIAREQEALEIVVAAAGLRAAVGVAELEAELRRVNEQLWEIEDSIREHERQQRFDAALSLWPALFTAPMTSALISSAASMRWWVLSWWRRRATRPIERWALGWLGPIGWPQLANRKPSRKASPGSLPRLRALSTSSSWLSSCRKRFGSRSRICLRIT